MTEMVVPGTYITVRPEGLISAGRVATGIVGVVGTAANGPIGTPVTLAGLADARATFGLPEDGAYPLSLMRALEYIYGNGAASIIAVRVAASSNSSATYALQDADGHTVAVLTAKEPGTWGNEITIRSKPAEDPCRIEEETHTDSFDQLDRTPVRPSPENRLIISRGTSRRTPELVYREIVRNEEVQRTADDRFFLVVGADEGTRLIDVASVNRVRVVDDAGEVVREFEDPNIVYGAGTAPDAGEVRINNATGELTFAATEVPEATERVLATYAADHPDPETGQVLLTVWDGSLDYPDGEAPQQASGDTLVASYLIDPAVCTQVTIAYGGTTEEYVVPDGDLLAYRVNRSSLLVAGEADDTNGDGRPEPETDNYFGRGANTPGNNGAEAGKDEYELGLEALENTMINIVVLAGQDAEDLGSSLLAHLNITEQNDFERIGVIGAAGNRIADFLGHSMSDDRVILVAPGLRYEEGTTTVALPPAYTAAAVAGLISSFPVRTSLTNKVLNVPGLDTSFNRGQQAQLIGRNVLAIIEREGFRVVKGITTEGEGQPFSAIPTRRIVDYAKYGVRSAANPYIGRLNNARVRAALQSTLDAFLTRMVEDEALTGYELQVSATRPQEIAGEVSVVMTLQPVFSIEFVRVVMNLQ